MNDIPDFDPSKPFEASGDAPEFDPSKPFTDAGQSSGSQPGFSWSSAVTDIPNEIYNAGSDALSAIGKLRDRGSMGPVEGLLATGRAAAAVPELLMSPVTGAYRSLIGHTMANAEHAVGSAIAPDIAAKDDPNKMYETAKRDADTAMSAAAARQPVAPSILPNVPKPATIGDFDVPLTAGQATGDFSNSAIERQALRGGMGQRAQNVAQNFMDEQAAALENARAGIGRNLDRYGQQIVSDPNDAASMAAQSLRDQAAAAKQQSSDLYGKAFDLPGEIHADAFEGIGNSIKRQLSIGDNPVIVDDRTTPFANRALQDIEQNIDRLKIPNRAQPPGAPVDASDVPDVVGINLRGIDQTRKRLLSFAKDAKKYPPDADTRATQAIIHAFDDHVEDAITRGLFSGDDRALQYLKDARAAYSNYRKTFTPQGGGDDVGRAVQKIIGNGEGQQATPTEVANYLYGSANVGAKGLSARLATRLKGILGEQSPEWDGVRQGLWSRLTQSTEGRTDWGPQKVSERIAEFLNGSGKPLAEKMFSPAERDLMARYGDLLKKLVPPPGSVNYSNNLPMLNRIAENLDKHVGTVIGEKIGGIPGAVAGYGAGKATSGINSIMNARRVAKLMPTLGQSIQRWQRAKAAASRVGQPSTAALVTASGNLAKNLTNIGFDYTSTLRMLQGAVPAGAENEQQQP